MEAENTQTEVKKRNTNRISVIEYKGQLFRTDEELKAYKQIELMSLFESLTYTHKSAVMLIDGLIENVVTTKQKLIDFRDAFIAEKMKPEVEVNYDLNNAVESAETTNADAELTEDEEADKF